MILSPLPVTYFFHSAIFKVHIPCCLWLETALEDSTVSSMEWPCTWSQWWTLLYPARHSRASLYTSPLGPRWEFSWEHLPTHGISGEWAMHTLHLMSYAGWLPRTATPAVHRGSRISANTRHYPPLQFLLTWWYGIVALVCVLLLIFSISAQLRKLWGLLLRSIHSLHPLVSVGVFSLLLCRSSLYILDSSPFLGFNHQKYLLSAPTPTVRPSANHENKIKHTDIWEEGSNRSKMKWKVNVTVSLKSMY